MTTLYGLIFGFVANQMITDNKDFISPYIAAKIVMEAAIPMSRIDPKLISDS